MFRFAEAFGFHSVVPLELAFGMGLFLRKATQSYIARPFVMNWLDGRAHVLRFEGMGPASGREPAYFARDDVCSSLI